MPVGLLPHPPIHGMTQVNLRDALLLILVSSEAMVDSRRYSDHRRRQGSAYSVSISCTDAP